LSIEGQLKTLVDAATISSLPQSPATVTASSVHWSAPPCIRNNVPSSSPPSSPLSIATSLPVPILAPTTISPPETVAASSPVAASAADLVSTPKVLVLGNGTRLTFDSRDVPDPLMVSFAKDIARLGRVWDDTRPEFNALECTLKIKGHAIAVKHWPTCYKYSHDRQWDGIKKIWNEWKVRLGCNCMTTYSYQPLSACCRTPSQVIGG